ncbi:hypothetical protein [Williamsia sp.]|uniref:hypothetical protein n=1 Tax=Williamsia sp. TaxID=1872085 RepID=UPI001A2553AF|nr:hypothetical protein [Williamsia sp.]MBJ7289166.1 hypothetical protein [Williamsia sp.]
MKGQSAGASARTHHAVGALMMGTLLCLATGCTSAVDGSGRVDAVAAGQYRADQSSSAARSSQAATSEAEYSLCATVSTSAVSMLRTYNAFVAALNSKQDYADLGGVDRRAVDEFARGSGAITDALTGEVSDGVRAPAQAFVDRTAALSRAVGTRTRAPLNAASTAWIRARDAILDSCGPYAASSSSATPAVPASPSGSPGG